ncbi:diphthamide biosynthesis enzyme Dph2 [Methanobacterium paludis]|uniref:2-(3-amino-3-carboxypropyl)histidine synthase n=1 Tax=Methanobacterium paludis (strain DSM 25820 / JCM 18151 / SWAN1) TaxID=868131 RepID=F6D511_METPW|nr:diphthamide biosynthesis enzyme Dph2 [Methanobacterium paludis]AEG19290.1 universal diphthamide biosynthesis domain-containing protein [Methanobacterium paludis]
MLDYEFKVNEIIERIKEKNIKSVGLQFPEGLKTYATDVARQIEDETDAFTLISADPCYGACDAADVDMAGAVDLLVHFGHTALPLDYDVPVLFVEAQSNMDVMGAVGSSLSLLEGYERIGLVTTAQHLHLLDEITSFLEGNGKKVVMKEGSGTQKGQVLGCNFSAIKDLDIDAVLYVGSGNFHTLGIKLFTDKPVVIADPYMNDARDIDEFADRIMRIRFARIAKAADAKRFGIIVSSKKGQSRLDLAKVLKNMIDKEEREAFIIVMDDISPELLVPFRDLDAFVVTACPRIAIDDSKMYKKPLLTPPELEIVLGKREWEDYEMDEIKYD